MPKITLSREALYGGRFDQERYELLLFRGELQEWPERYRAAKYMLPLIDKRLQAIEDERKELGLPESNPVEYAEKERDYDLEVGAQFKAQQELDNGNGLST